MACRTCPDCGIDFPALEDYRTCPACGVCTTYQATTAHDFAHQAKAAAVAARLATLAAEELNEIPHVDATVTVDDEGLMWLSSHDAIRAGTGNHLTMAETDVITIGPPHPFENQPHGNLYEVLAYVDKKRAYWVRPLLVPDHV